jgi:predicted flap endonuclease-1-like 5' DNA nuclease
MANVKQVEGIGPVYAEKLAEAGISTIHALLEKGASSQGRKEIAAKTGISQTLILEWVNHADLFRVKGVGEEYADLLEATGVDTVPELAQRHPDNLYQQMVEKNQTHKRVRRLPPQGQVKNWVEQAKRLPRKVTY